MHTPKPKSGRPPWLVHHNLVEKEVGTALKPFLHTQASVPPDGGFFRPSSRFTPHPTHPMKTHIFLPISLAILSLFALFGTLHHAQAAPHSDPVAQAVAFLQSQQQPDGGLDAFGFGASNTSGTARALLALASQGYDPAMLTASSGQSALDYLAAQAITYTHDASGTTAARLFPANAGLLLTAASATNANPHAFGGMDLIAQLTATYHPASGAYSTTAVLGWTSGAASALNQAWSILGLSAVGEPVPLTATTYLISLQAADGSWDWGSPDSTGLAVLALLGSGHNQPTDAPIQAALTFLADTQLSSGGWRPSWDSDPLNADSTAWALQALAAAGYAPHSQTWNDPAAALLTLQQSDGRIGGTYANAYSTAEALFGLSGKPLYTLSPRTQARRALAWMAALQNADGSWSDFSSPNMGATADAVLAFAAAGYDPAGITASGNSPLDYLAANAAAYAAADPASAGKLALAVTAAGQDAHNFGGLNLVHVLTATHYSPTLGAFGVPTNTWHQSFAILGLAAAGEPIPVSATQNLLALQQPDGGWKYDLSPAFWNTTAPDNTGLALQALMAAGLPLTDTHLLSATAYLHNTQDPLGGWGNANSTAFALQGLLAAGEDLHAWRLNGYTPFQALFAYQKMDGPFVYQWDSPWSAPADNFFATRQAVPALLGVPFPIAGAPLTAFPAPPALPDSDRSLPGAPSAAFGSPGTLTLPFDGDPDQDAAFSLQWQPQGASTWFTATLHRADGLITATLPLTRPVTYAFSLTISDPDGVQSGSAYTTSLRLDAVLEPVRIYLPLIQR
ncbi:MAG: hypothetical protein Fur0018_04570 [Anaerolineales bacterium]